MELYDHQKKIVDENKLWTGLWLGCGCLAKDTPVRMFDSSLKKVHSLNPGDKVLSFDQFTNKFVEGEILEVVRTNTRPKPMIELINEKETIKVTYDHPFFNGEGFYPIYQLIWGEMETSQREKLELLCKQYGQTFNNKKTRGKYSCCNETCSRCERLSKDSDGWKDNQTTQNSRAELVGKSNEVSSNQSHKRAERRQQSGELGMVHGAIQCLVWSKDRENNYSDKSQEKFTNTKREGVDKGVLSEKDKNLTETQGKKSDIRFPSGKISQSVQTLSIRNCNTTYKVTEQEPYYTIILKNAPYTYCIGKEYNYITHNSGKTRTVLALAEGDTLVICEKQQREDKTWERELEQIGKELQLTVISKEDFRLNKFDYRRYDTVVLDEATWAMGVRASERQKNYVRFPDTSKVFLKLKKFLEDTKPKRFYPVTATIIKTPLTVFAAGVLLGKIDFKRHREFRDKYYFKLPMSGWTDIYSVRKGTEEDLAKIVHKLGYTGSLNDWNDVPEQTWVTKKIQLTAEQKREIKEAKIEYPDAVSQNGKVHQIENGVFVGNEFEPDRYIKDNKIEAILDYAVEFKQMIVVAKWTSHIKKIKEAIPDAYVLNGQTKNRGEMMAELKKKDKYVLIVQAGISKGWELPDCPAVVFASNDYKWEDYNQMQGRVQRANNIKKNVYINLVSNYPNSMDQRVMNTLERGEDFNDAL